MQRIEKTTMNHNSFFPWTTSSLAFNPPTHGLVTTTPDDPWTNFRLAKKKCCPKSWKLGNCWVFCPPFWLAKLWASSRCFTKKLLLLMKTNPIENTQAKFANSSTRFFFSYPVTYLVRYLKFHPHMAPWSWFGDTIQSCPAERLPSRIWNGKS